MKRYFTDSHITGTPTYIMGEAVGISTCELGPPATNNIHHPYTSIKYVYINLVEASLSTEPHPGIEKKKYDFCNKIEQIEDNKWKITKVYTGRFPINPTGDTGK